MTGSAVAELGLPPGAIDLAEVQSWLSDGQLPEIYTAGYWSDISDRVLKAGGRIIVVGEHQLGLRTVARRFLSVLLRQRAVVTDFRRLFPPDPLLGDHYYTHSDYCLMFSALGYRLQHRIAATGTVLYVADKTQ